MSIKEMRKIIENKNDRRKRKQGRLVENLVGVIIIDINDFSGGGWVVLV
jgi:hypothetical protein